MPTPTYTPLANITLGSSSSSVTFSSIPATYRDLVLILRGSFTATSGAAGFRLNGDSGSNYPSVFMRGNGSNAASATANESYGPIWYAGDPSTGMAIVSFMDYSATDKHKTALTRDTNNNSHTAAYATRWANTAAVNSIQVLATATTWVAGTTFALYGIAS
jgi:hypothetical protein